MNTPIYDFLKKYDNDNFLRLHMPGHKGKGFLNEQYDITEIKGADSLFEANGIINESEENASKLFNTEKTLYSTQGSTLAIQAMLTLATSKSHDEKPLIIAVRNAHKAFINACILLDLDVKWIFPDYKEGSITSGQYSADEIEKSIITSDKKPSAVYITSPDYLGKMADVKAISSVCKKHKISLLVDNAHGAYLNFLKDNIHPINLGADMCCDSAHKTLPVLTGGAYLHISKSADKSFSKNAKSSMALFASTSPSYLALASLDLCNKYLEESIRKELEKLIPVINNLKRELKKFGLSVCDSEPLKISICTLNLGLYGYQFAEILRENKIECEYADDTHIVLMISTYNTIKEIEKLKKVLLGISKQQNPLDFPAFNFVLPKIKMSIRKAALSPSEEIETDKALGRICSKIVVACPPGIPVVVSGEVISENVIKILKRYSILSVNVVK